MKYSVPCTKGAVAAYLTHLCKGLLTITLDTTEGELSPDLLGSGSEKHVCDYVILVTSLHCWTSLAEGRPLTSVKKLVI